MEVRQGLTCISAELFYTSETVGGDLETFSICSESSTVSVQNVSQDSREGVRDFEWVQQPESYKGRA